MTAKMPRRFFGRTRARRGQSLVEFALSMSVFVLLFSGVVDLGRAFFAWVELQSAVTEGAHWAAIYPACIANANNYNGGTVTQCQQSNAIDQRILNEDGQVFRANYLCVAAAVTNGSGAAHPGPGDDVNVGVKYQVPLVTPFMQAMFGKSLIIYANAHEMIRGLPTDAPNIAPVNVTNQGGITVGCSVP